MRIPRRKVAVAGGFDPLHIGHIRHLEAAKALGEYLIVLVSSDADMIRKKDYCFMPLNDRIEIIRALRCVDEVEATIDGDGTMAKTLLKIRPDIFAKGGDRTQDNMPKNELDVCDKIGCRIVYGVGGNKDASSSELVRKASGNISRISTH